MSEQFDLMDLYDAEEQGFTIDNDSKANWAVKKILADRKTTERLVALANYEIHALAQKIDQLEAKQEQREYHLKGLLHFYFDNVEPTRQTKTQATYQLLDGRLTLKKQQPTYQRNDDLLVWAKANTPDLVETTERVAWGELKKQTTTIGTQVVLTETGETIPGITVEERPDVFDIQE